MFEILMFLFENYFDSGNYPDSDKLSLRLTAAGFDDEDIHLALNWLSGLKNLSVADYPADLSHCGTRCYAELETRRISMEGLRFLFLSEQSGAITPVEREMIIDRAVALGRDQLSPERVKLITLMVLRNLHENLDPILVEELLFSAEPDLLH